ncbi:uncharacterized protein LOC143004913 [Genypterus blacodes]|uniref:uncharacterized protein LOC143004913 n=1 Tax=Genypterus blacodes TaxID=154954 RepID=UPI003F75A6EF
MASTLVLLLQLLLISLASASHYMAGTSSITAKGRNPDGTFKVEIRYRATFRHPHCSYHSWNCFHGNCGSQTTLQRGQIDSSTNPTPNLQWCESESVTTRNIPTNKPFALKASSCCWIRTNHYIGSWKLLTSVDLGTRSDTKGPNKSPDVAILPLLRLPQNCHRSYRLMSHDPDGDQVRCRYGSASQHECVRCSQHGGFTLDQSSCTLSYQNAPQGYYAHEMVVEDFPQEPITLTYTDGSISRRAPLTTTTTTATAPITTTTAQTTTTTAPTTTTTTAPTTTTTTAPTTTTTTAPTTTTTTAPTTTTTTAPTTTTPNPWWWTTTTTAPTTTTTTAPTTTTTTAPTTTTTTAPTTTTTTAPTTTTTTAPTTTTTTTAPTTTTRASPSWRRKRQATTTAPTTTTTTTTAPTTTTTAPPTTTTAPTTTTTAPTTTTTAPTTTTTTAPTTTTTQAWTTTTTTAPTTTTIAPTTTAPTTTTTTAPTTTTTAPTTTTTTTAPTTTTIAPTTTAPTTTTTTAPTTTSTTPTRPPYSVIPLSKLPLQFTFLVDLPVSSCLDGDFMPKLLSPTPTHGQVFQAQVNREVQIRVKARAQYATLSGIIMSGPLNISKHRTTHDEFVIKWTPAQDDAGNDYPICFAVESQNGNRFYHSEMRCVLVKVGPCAVKTNVICHESSMTVEIDKSTFIGLHEDQLRLNDPSNTICSIQRHSNSTHVVAVVPLNACGTEIEEDEENLIFKNEITTFDVLSDVITRKHLLEVEFYCQYPKRENVTLGFTAHRENCTVWDKGFGTFTYEFEFYPNRQFNTRVDPNSYPLVYDLGTDIFMQIQATSSLNNTELFVESCRASPYDNPNYWQTYSIIENGCTVDPSVNIYAPAHQKQFRFSMEAFKFIGLHDQVYISCSVLVCEAGNPQSRCSRGCMNSTTQHSVGKREAVIQSTTHFISQGPLRLRRSIDSTERMGSAATNLNLNLVFIAGCLLATVGMVCAVAMYKVKMSKVKYQPLPTSES